LCAAAFMEEMHERTQIGFLDNTTGVLRTDKMGQHIVDWMSTSCECDQTVQFGEFTASNHMSVTNAYAVRALEALAEQVCMCSTAFSLC
jgi:hypothetical protein